VSLEQQLRPQNKIDGKVHGRESDISHPGLDDIVSMNMVWGCEGAGTPPGSWGIGEHGGSLIGDATAARCDGGSRLTASRSPWPEGCNGRAQRSPLPRWWCNTPHILRAAGAQDSAADSGKYYKNSIEQSGCMTRRGSMPSRVIQLQQRSICSAALPLAASSSWRCLRGHAALQRPSRAVHDKTARTAKSCARRVQMFSCRPVGGLSDCCQR
jgi:hypothetical protein